jgi:hypothetical protein
MTLLKDYIIASAIIRSMPAPMEFALGERLRLRKPHPCGGYDWQVTRLGADIGLKCETCGRQVLLSRRELEKRLKTKLPPS